MRFVTLFPKAQNVHLVKDIGMIPWLLRKNHGIDSELVCWPNGDYPYLETEVKGMKLSFIKKSPFGRIYDGCHYLKYEAPSIDVLNLYHLNLASFFYERVYLKYNPMGRIYLKLDMNNKGFSDCLKQTPKAWIKRATIKKAEIVSVENKQMYEALNNHFPGRLLYLPNGYHESSKESEEVSETAAADSTPYRIPPHIKNKKHDIILTVGNLGTYEKATDVLLAAFAKSAEKHNCSLRLIGPVEPEFEDKINEFYEKYPDLKERVTFTGRITDRKELAGQYKKARFFVLPSRSESFGFVLLEAGLEGCYLIASDGCSAARDITDNEKYGRIVKADDENALAEAFAELCGPDTLSEFRGEELAEYIRKNYNWDTIIQKLYERLTA